MKVTYKSLRDVAFHEAWHGQPESALATLDAALAADPMDLEIRFLAADVFVKLQAWEALEKTLACSAEIAMRAGHPMAAIHFLHALEKLGRDADSLWKNLAFTYSSDSTKISPSGSRVAPLPDDTPVDAPQAGVLTLAELVERVARRVQTITRNEDFPSRVLPMPLLSDVPAAHFVETAKLLVPRHLAPGQFLIREGEIGKSFYMVAAGSLSVFKTDPLGRAQMLATLHAGAIVGEMALVQDSPRTASVRADGFARVLEFPAENVHRLAVNLERVAAALDKFTRERLLANLMNTSPLFKPFSRTQRMELLKHFHAYVVEPETVVVQQGEEGSGLYLILGGEVEVVRDRGTADALTLATLGPPESFGEISLLTGSPTTATVVATRRTTLLFLARTYFLRLVEAVPEMRAYFTRLAETRLAQNEELASMAPPSGEEEEIVLI